MNESLYAKQNTAKQMLDNNSIFLKDCMYSDHLPRCCYKGHEEN